MIFDRYLLLLLVGAFQPTLGFFTSNEECYDYAPPAVIHGKKFFNSFSGEYLPLKGISYYPRPNEGELTETNSMDFFTEEYRNIWERDIRNFKRLGVNAVRIYAVNPGKNHDAFMCALKKAGIYAIVGLAADCLGCAVGGPHIAPPDCYPPELKERGQFIIKEFSKYENVLAFEAGNEVSLSSTEHSLDNAPCQKKFLRDMKAYVNRCSTGVDKSMRKIPIGLAEADIDREAKALYLNCRSNPNDEMENADFFGINTYLHCDGSAENVDDLLGYTQLLKDFQGFGVTVPVVVTEFGCLNESFEKISGYETQRDFAQVDALFSAEYMEEFAGGFAFEYSTEKKLSQDTSPWPFRSFGPNNWGVGYFEPEDCDDLTIQCNYVPFPQFNTLKNKYANVYTADEMSLARYNETWREPNLPTCPAEIAPLSAFYWQSDAFPDLECPVEVPVYCPGIPSECTSVNTEYKDTSTSSLRYGGSSSFLLALAAFVLSSTVQL